MKILTPIVHNILKAVAYTAKQFPNNPYFHCYTINNGTTEYLTRVKFPRLFGWRIMLHRIHRADSDRDMHNHPWKQAYSILLTGSYIEERLIQDILPFAIERECRHIRWFNVLHKEDCHRIDSIKGPLWTLFIAGERQIVDGIEWGFLDEKNRKLIPHTEYKIKSGAQKI